jgi:hypothetical protein
MTIEQKREALRRYLEAAAHLMHLQSRIDKLNEWQLDLALRVIASAAPPNENNHAQHQPPLAR